MIALPVETVQAYFDAEDRRKTIRWYLWQVLKGGGGTALVGALWWLLTSYLDMRSQLASIPAQVKAEVSSQVNDTRKELTAESKQAQQDFALYKEASELERVIRDASCQGNIDTALSSYTLFVNRIKPQEIPESLKLPIYRTLVDAMVRSGRYDFLGDDELTKADAVLRKDVATCGGSSQLNVAMLFTARGQYDKAKSLLLTMIEAAGTARRGSARSQSDDLAGYYAVYLIIDLRAQTERDPEKRASKTWATLAALEERFQVRTQAIEAHLKGTSMAALTFNVGARGDVGYVDSFAHLLKLVSSRDFVPTMEERDTPLGKVTEVRVREVNRLPLPKAPVVPAPAPPVGKPPEC